MQQDHIASFLFFFFSQYLLCKTVTNTVPVGDVMCLPPAIQRPRAVDCQLTLVYPGMWREMPFIRCYQIDQLRDILACGVWGWCVWLVVDVCHAIAKSTPRLGHLASLACAATTQVDSIQPGMI